MQHYNRQFFGWGLRSFLASVSSWVASLLLATEPLFFGIFVPQDHILRRIDRAVDWRPIIRKLEQAYKVGRGSISAIHPFVLFRMMIVMVIYAIRSERELVRRIHADMAARWFCKLGLIGRVPSNSTLTRMRRDRLSVLDFHDVFVEVFAQCIKKGLVQLDLVLADATEMLARAQRRPAKEMAETVFAQICKHFFGVEHVQPGDDQAAEDLHRLAKSVCDATGYSVNKPEKLLQAIRNGAEKVGKTIVTLTGQLREIAGRSKMALKEKVRDVIRSVPHAIGDGDARVGTLSRKGNFLGYVPTLMTDSYRGVVSALELVPANIPPWTIVGALWAQHKQNLRSAGVSELPKAIALDSGFDYESVHKLFENDGIQAYIAPRSLPGKQGVLCTDLWSFDSGGELICPNGTPMRQVTHKPSQDGQIIYEGTACPNCSLRSKCTTRKKRRVKIVPERHKRRQVQLQQLKDDAYKKAMITRLQVERHIWHLTDPCQMRRSRYWGRAMNSWQCLLAAIVHNMTLLALYSSIA
jgi:transposase